MSTELLTFTAPSPNPASNPPSQPRVVHYKGKIPHFTRDQFLFFDWFKDAVFHELKKACHLNEAPRIDVTDNCPLRILPPDPEMTDEMRRLFSNRNGNLVKVWTDKPNWKIQNQKRRESEKRKMGEIGFQAAVEEEAKKMKTELLMLDWLEAQKKRTVVRLIFDFFMQNPWRASTLIVIGVWIIPKLWTRRAHAIPGEWSKAFLENKPLVRP